MFTNGDLIDVDPFPVKHRQVIIRFTKKKDLLNDNKSTPRTQSSPGLCNRDL